MDGQERFRPREGKTFSHCRTKFPLVANCLASTVQQGAQESQAQQVVAIGMTDAERSGAQGAGGGRKGHRSRQRGTGNFEDKLRGGRQRASYRHQSPSSADVQGSRKLKKFLALVVSAAHKDRDRQGQAGPSATFLLGSAAKQSSPQKLGFNQKHWHLTGQIPMLGP